MLDTWEPPFFRSRLGCSEKALPRAPVLLRCRGRSITGWIEQSSSGEVVAFDLQEDGSALEPENRLVLETSSPGTFILVRPGLPRRVLAADGDIGLVDSGEQDQNDRNRHWIVSVALNLTSPLCLRPWTMPMHIRVHTEDNGSKNLWLASSSFGGPQLDAKLDVAIQNSTLEEACNARWTHFSVRWQPLTKTISIIDYQGRQVAPLATYGAQHGAAGLRIRGPHGYLAGYPGRKQSMWTMDRQSGRQWWELVLSTAVISGSKASDGPKPWVDVTDAPKKFGRGARNIQGSIQIPDCAPAAAWAAVADFDRLHEYIDDIRFSRSENAEARAIVQRGGHGVGYVEEVHKFLFFTLVARLTVECTADLSKGRIENNQMKCDALRCYKAVWTVDPAPVETKKDSPTTVRVDLNLIVAPTVPAPAFILDGLSRHSTAVAFENIRSEAQRQTKAMQLAQPAKQKPH